MSRVRFRPALPGQDTAVREASLARGRWRAGTDAEEMCGEERERPLPATCSRGRARRGRRRGEATAFTSAWPGPGSKVSAVRRCPFFPTLPPPFPSPAAVKSSDVTRPRPRDWLSELCAPLLLGLPTVSPWKLGRPQLMPFSPCTCSRQLTGAIDSTSAVIVASSHSAYKLPAPPRWSRPLNGASALLFL